MRRYLKKEINRIMDTIAQAGNILQKDLMNNQMNKVKILAEDLSGTVESLMEVIVEDDEAALKCKECLMAYEEALIKCLNAKKTADKLGACALLKKRLEQAREILDYEVLNDKLQIVFMPYKADMWTSMASIWESAMADDDCEACVVPIPYSDITNPEKVSFCYELERFPKELGCVHYENYSEEERYPDIIVIHNPYDEANNVTRVPERFFSSTLINHTAKLVYSPYYTLNTYVEQRHGASFVTPANRNADIIICQSQRMKAIYESIGYSTDKIVAFGSPKIDAVINSKITKDDIPEKWKEKIGQKKVFLLNTHLSYFPTSYINKGKTGDYAVRFHEEIAKAFLDRDDCALIWRPHPLLKTMLKGRFPQCLDYVNSFEERVVNAKNGIVDEQADYFYAFACSDALLSTWSSLINEYMVTQKPVMIFQTQVQKDVALNSPINGNVNYFRFGAGGLTFERFRDNVIMGVDSKKQDRMDEIAKAFPNLDGSAGSKIYKFLKEN